ncbi:MAG: hypothetical protein AAF492_18960, partial [Verrucomicrobiota bacterium]
GLGTGSFSTALSGLYFGVEYVYTIYASNAASGAAWASVVPFRSRAATTPCHLPGLIEGRLTGSDDETTPNPGSTVVLSPEKAETNQRPPWGGNETWVYTGEIYFNGGTYHFAENVDDNSWLMIDGTIYINNNNWNVPTRSGPINLAPGWYPIELRFGNGGGGAGAVGQNGWTTSKGFGYNIDGADSLSGTDYINLLDDGSGSLLRHLPLSNCIALADTFIETTNATGVTGTSATLNGIYGASGSVFTVTAYYGETDGGTSTSAWDQSVVLGVYTNVLSTNLSVGVSGLVQGTTYFFTFLISNVATSFWAPDGFSFSTPAAPPSVSNLPPANVWSITADVGGSVFDTGGDAPLVTLFYGLTDVGTAFSWDAFIDLGAQTGDFQVALSGLLEQSMYYYRVYATNSGGIGWAPASDSFMTLLAAPPVVETLAPTNIGANTALLLGNVTDPGNDPPIVTLYYGPFDGGTNAAVWDKSVVMGLRTNAFAVPVSGLDPDTRYYVRAFAANSAGSMWAAQTFSFTTLTSPPLSVVINEIHYDPQDKTRPR